MKRSAPAFTIREGSSSVRGYKYGNTESRKSARYCLLWYRFSGDKPQRETRTGERAARDRAREIAIALANGRAEIIELTNADRESYLHAKSLLPLGVPLHVAIEEWKTLRTERAERIRHTAPPSKVILDEMLADLKDHRRSDRHTKGLERDLKPFVTKHPDVERFTESDGATYLRELQCGPRRRDNIRNAIAQHSRFARRRGYLPDRKSAAEKIGKIEAGHDVQTWTVREAALLLEHVSSDWLPWLALGLFAGLRSSEIFRLEWSAVKFDQEIIAVSRRVARKVRISRIIPMQENLCGWLAPYREKFGLIYPGNFKTNENAKGAEMNRLRKLLGLPRRDNANRHSFGSNRVAVVKSYEQVAVEMGNSPRKVREDYNDPKDEREGKEYFALSRPTESANVLALEFA